MELVEEHVLPHALQFGGRIVFTQEPPGQRRIPFRGQSQALAPVVALLDRDRGGVATGETLLQFSGHWRMIARVGDDDVAAVVVQTAMLQRGVAVGQTPDGVKIVPRCPAAVVACPPETRHVHTPGFGQFAYSLDLAVQGISGMRAVPDAWWAQGSDPGTVHPFPCVDEVGEFFLAGYGPEMDVTLVSRELEKLRQVAVVPERVKVARHRGHDSELVREQLPAEEDLARKGLAAREIAVRLQIPAPDDHPTARRDMRFDPCEEFRPVVSHPAIEQGFVVVEDELGILVQKIGRGFEGGKRFCEPLFPIPDPDGVDVGLADQMDLRVVVGHARLSSRCS